MGQLPQHHLWILWVNDVSFYCMQYCVVVLKRLWSKIPYLHIPALLLISCVALGKILYLSVPVFLYEKG